jgi:hypothetical protein
MVVWSKDWVVLPAINIRVRELLTESTMVCGETYDLDTSQYPHYGDDDSKVLCLGHFLPSFHLEWGTRREYER